MHDLVERVNGVWKAIEPSKEPEIASTGSKTPSAWTSMKEGFTDVELGEH